jgi:hypothetical protein
MSNDLTYCDVILGDLEDYPVSPVELRVLIRSRPSLVVGDNVFKLEEFDF